jgi:hypothetical protein
MAPPKVTAVRKGEPLSLPAADFGYARKEAPADGLYFETDEVAFFVSAVDLRNELHKIARLPPVEPPRSPPPPSSPPPLESVP